MEKPNLKKQERCYLKLNRIILTVIFSIMAIVTSTILMLNSAHWWIVGIELAVVGTVYLLIFIYQGAAYRHFGYAMDDFGLYINRGVFWRRKIVVPRNRVQHTDVIQGPLERRLKLAELIVHTAGTRNASVKLPGILHKEAESLRESLSFEESNDAV